MQTAKPSTKYCERDSANGLKINFNLQIMFSKQNRSTARLATSMSAFPILAVQKQPRVRVFTD